MPWIILVVAGLFEIAWAVGLKYTHGFTRLWPTVFTAVCLALSMGLLGLAAKRIPISSAYAVWTGIGIIGTFVFGVCWLGEPISTARVVCICLILLGAIGLKLA